MAVELDAQHLLQPLLVHVLGQAHVEVQHRVLRPFRFQLLNGQSREQVLPAFEETMKRAGQQRLAESAGTAQEHILGRTISQAIDIFCLVDIQIVLRAKFRKGLDPYRIKSGRSVHKHVV